MRQIILFAGLALSLWGGESFSSPLLDQQYGFHRVAVAVLSSPEEPIHAAQVEKEILQQLKQRMRFEYQQTASADLKKSLESVSGPALTTATVENLKGKNVDAALLAELIRNDQGLDLNFTLMAVEPGEVIGQSNQKVDMPLSQDRIAQKTLLAFNELVKNIPFDGSILKREGYLVILDGGSGVFAPGMRLPTYTVEKEGEGPLKLNETGHVLIQRADENLSFAKILVENKPLEVMAGNKVRTAEKLASQQIPELMQEVNDANRDLASELVSDFEVNKGEVGRTAFSMGMEMVQFRNLSVLGDEDTASVFFPSALLEGELWFTSRWFMETSWGFGLGRSANASGQLNQSQGASLSTFRLQFGYRMNVLAPERGPVVYAKLGYGRQSYSLGKIEPVRFSSIAFGGMLLSGGIRVPIDDKWNAGAEINTLIFPSVGEQPYSSGAQKSNITAWDLILKSTYSATANVDFDARLIFRNSGAEFSGDTPRPDPISQSSQNSRILQVGASYYF